MPYPDLRHPVPVIGWERSVSRYTEQERAEQTAAVAELVRQGCTHRQIQERLGISLATVHERRREAAGLAEAVDLESAVAVRREAGTTARSWLARIEDGFAAGVVDPLAASKEAHRWTTMLARLYSAFAPIRLAVEADVRADVHMDRTMLESIQDTLEHAAKDWADGFAQRWELPEEAREQLFERLRPWREDDDRPVPPDHAGWVS